MTTWGFLGFFHIKFYSCTHIRIFYKKKKITLCSTFYVEIVAKYVYGCPVMFGKMSSTIFFFFFFRKTIGVRTDEYGAKFHFKNLHAFSFSSPFPSETVRGASGENFARCVRTRWFFTLSWTDAHLVILEPCSHVHMMYVIVRRLHVYVNDNNWS